MKTTTLEKKRINSIKRMAKNHEARKVKILKIFNDGSIELLFICDSYNIRIKNKNNVFDQLGIDYK